MNCNSLLVLETLMTASFGSSHRLPVFTSPGWLQALIQAVCYFLP